MTDRVAEQIEGAGAVEAPAGRAEITLIGLGVIGLPLALHLAGAPAVGRLTLIDHDRYDAGNIRSQGAARTEVGRPKARAAADRIHRCVPDLPVIPIVDRVERVPLGMLRGDVIVSAVDSRGARRYANQAARRLGVPLVDAGVSRDGLLVRINVHPAGEAACLECDWSEADYGALEHVYSCIEADATAPATRVPSALGGLAAALAALEVMALFESRAGDTVTARQQILSAEHRRHQVSTLRRNPACLCGHDAWTVEPLVAPPARTTVEDFLELVGAERRGGPPGFGMEERSFVRQLVCTACGALRPVLRLEGRLERRQRRCACGADMVPIGFDQLETITAAALTPGQRKRSLASLGLAAGDILGIVGADGTRRVELAPPAPEGGSHVR